MTKNVLKNDDRVIDQAGKGERDSPSTMVLIVLAPRFNAMKAARQEMGMESNTEIVARRLPRKRSIISAVSTGQCRLVDHVLHRNLHKHRLIDTTAVFSVFGISSRCFTASRMPFTILIVFDPPPCFKIGMYTEC